MRSAPTTPLPWPRAPRRSTWRFWWPGSSGATRSGSSDLTFIATANAADQCGARITLVDSEPDSWNLDPRVVIDELARRATAGETQPKAIVPVHLLGHPADLAPIVDAAQRHGVRIVEDAAEALGSTWRGGAFDGRAPGTVGDFGIYSFNFNKVISTGGGGMVVARDPASWRGSVTSGRRPRSPGSDYVHDEIGFNYRMSNVAAAIGVQQIARLPQLVEQRRAIAAAVPRRVRAARPRERARPPVGPSDRVGCPAWSSPTRRRGRRSATRWTR